MHIDSKDTIAGIPILKVRKLLRKGQSGDWSVETAVRLLDITPEVAEDLVAELVERELIERSPLGAGVYWRNTIAGNALAIASAARPIKRKTAEKALAELLERVEQVNTDPYYLCKVQKVLVFGSYLTDAERLSDVDVAVDVVVKEEDQAKRQKLFEQRTREARSSGRHFRDIIEEFAWPMIEVMKFLKSRSRSISLHTMDDRILQTVDYQVVYSEEPETE